MEKLKYWLKRIYLLSLSAKKQEEFVWKELKKNLDESNLKYGVYEREKYISVNYELSDGNVGDFYYFVSDNTFVCSVHMHGDYPTALTTDLFILAAHFNNILNNGVVIVNVQDRHVEYRITRDLLIPLLYTGEIYFQLIRHIHTSKDVFLAFRRLIVEQEAPAIIIADMLSEKKSEPDNSN